MARISKVAIAAALMALVGCGGNGYGGIDDPPPPPPPNDGKTIDANPSLAFTPATLTVTAGDVVAFRFGSVAHNVFFDGVAGAPGDIPGQIANATVNRTFATRGTYAYSCRIHPEMRGTVVVQ